MQTEFLFYAMAKKNKNKNRRLYGKLGKFND